MQTFIRAAERWIPSDDHTVLEFGGGIFGDLINFQTISKQLCFGMGEGLPGQAWQEGRPILLKDFGSQHFRRGVAAKAAGLQCAVAIPCYVQSRLSAVLVLYCGDQDGMSGGIELWGNDPRVTSDMTLVDGYYGAANPELESDSKEVYLPRGTGLPGLAWQRGAAVFMDNIATSVRFLRGLSAAQAGLQCGLAMPCDAQGSQAFVLSLLSALNAPVARRIESWVADASQHQLRCEFAYGQSQGQGPLVKQEAVTPLDQGQGAIGQAFSSGVPQFEPQTKTAPLSLIAIPVVSEGAVTEVVALYL